MQGACILMQIRENACLCTAYAYLCKKLRGAPSAGKTARGPRPRAAKKQKKKQGTIHPAHLALLRPSAAGGALLFPVLCHPRHLGSLISYAGSRLPSASAASRYRLCRAYHATRANYCQPTAESDLCSPRGFGGFSFPHFLNTL